MPHTHANHFALLARIRRLKGQVEAIERAQGAADLIDIFGRYLK